MHNRSLLVCGALYLLAGMQSVHATTCTPGGGLPNCTLDPVNKTVIRPEDCGANGFDAVDDTNAWKSAIFCATSGVDFGTIAATSGAIYVISDTLRIKEVYAGGIEGNGATIEWVGQAAQDFFTLEDTQRVRIANLKVRVRADGATSKVTRAFHFMNVDPDSGGLHCSGAPGGIQWNHVFPGSNILDHVAIEGVDTNKLDYGIVFDHSGTNLDGKPLCDQGNDQSTIMNCDISNVTLDAIRIDGQNSHQHRIIATNATGATGSTQSVFVHNLFGGFASYSGYRGGFSDAEFLLETVMSPILIVDSNSEGCKRFIRTPTGNNDFSMRVRVLNARFAAMNGFFASDGYVIDWSRLGVLEISGFQLEGDWTGTNKPKIHFAPTPNPPFDPPVKEAQLIVHGMAVALAGSDATTWDPIYIGPHSRLVSYGNACVDDVVGTVKPCIGLAGGLTSTSAHTLADLNAIVSTSSSGLRDGYVAFCSDCKGDPATGACISGGTGAQASRLNGGWRCNTGEVLPDAAQTLTNKNLTAANNVFPGLGTFSFQGTAPGANATTFFGPAGAVNSTSGLVQAFVPSLTVKSLRCRATATGLTSSKKVQIWLRKNGSDQGSACSLDSASGTCSQPESASYNGTSDLLDLRVTTTGNPGGSVWCTTSMGF